MGSGNFEIGKGLSMKGFNDYVKPFLLEYKAEVTDVMQYTDRVRNGLIVSLRGGVGNQFGLENTVKVSLNEAAKILSEQEKVSSESKSAWAHEVKESEGVIFNTLGLYKNNETASKVFQNLAIEYSAKNIDSVLSKVENSINEFGKKFSRF